LKKKIFEKMPKQLDISWTWGVRVQSAKEKSIKQMLSKK